MTDEETKAIENAVAKYFEMHDENDFEPAGELEDVETDFDQSLIETHINNLRELKISFEKPNSLAKGDIVIWKKGLKNKANPKYGQPAIIIDILAKPILDEEEGPGSAYFHEELDMKIGILIGEKFLVFHCDSKRFELLKK